MTEKVPTGRMETRTSLGFLRVRGTFRRVLTFRVRSCPVLRFRGRLEAGILSSADTPSIIHETTASILNTIQQFFKH